MGQEDALRGRVSRLVEPLDGKRLPRLVQSSHHLRAQALANTHRLYFSKLNGEASTTSCNSTGAINFLTKCNPAVTHSYGFAI
jgi:hypothetical protein